MFDYCAKEDIPILMTIPFSKDIAQTYAKGELLVKQPKWQDQFLALWHQINETMGGQK
ncbi:MAG: hypothetical protein KCCBMMGE_00112 [Candidatus Methanoperedenaceae archaeon GB37]|nr:MAG: hypothetical protein KCCBMMGE_00112 [Candidatus Methanoperedenaceae archaeon GB37]